MPMYKRPLLVLLFIAAAASGALLWNLSAEDAVQETALSSSSFEVSSAAEPEENSAPSVLTVYVSGEVNAPGLVEISSGSRIGDAVKACGGFTPLADRSAINLAQKAEDGMQINITARQEQAAGSTAAAPAANSNQGGSIVNLNTATKEELDTLPGIGPAMASRIIEYRRANGSFKSIEDIKEVKGIGEAKFAKMKDRLRI